MPNYDFKLLSPIDFECLTRDLLQEDLKVRLENFKAGRDKGIDLRYSKSKSGGIIVQCKHYAESSFSALFRHLRKCEVKKAKALKPKRYIFVTSLGLTPHQKNELVRLFHPLIKTPADIIGKETLNNLLGVFPEIEKRHFKLWFSSVPVLEEVLQARLKNLRRETMDSIKMDAKYFVYSPSFPEALQVLEEHNVCIIAGIPGIGKTTLAEMLLLHYARIGYDIVKIENDISEARGIDNRKEKRLFYYDDFLGQASTAEKLSKNEDQSIIDFIAAIKSSKISKLILTTREYILNQARLIYEKLSRSDFDGETYIVDLSKYTRLIRAQILFNHVYFSDLPRQFKHEILKGKSYLKLIDHKNYNPRIIDLMTEYSRIKNTKPAGYVEFFLSNMKNPFQIWSHAFENQLSQPARNLLLILTSMPGDVFLDDLRTTFSAYQKKSALDHGQPNAPHDFIRSLKELDGNFVASEKSNSDTILRFHNPSVRDFLQNSLGQNPAELLTLVQTAQFFDQLIWLWSFRELNNEFRFRSFLKTNAPDFIAALKRTLEYSDCRLANFKMPNGKLQKGRWNKDRADKVEFLVGVSELLPDQELVAFITEELKKIEADISNGKVSWVYLVGLIEKLKENTNCHFGEQNAFYSKAKELIQSQFYIIDSFKYWDRLKTACPEVVTKQDQKDVYDKLTEYLNSDVEGDDPDSIRHEASVLKELGEVFKIDVASKIKSLECHAEHLEENTHSESEDDERHGASSSTDYCSDAEIESIFNNLS